VLDAVAKSIERAVGGHLDTVALGVNGECRRRRDPRRKAEGGIMVT
jgi:hypothetical protein